MLPGLLGALGAVLFLLYYLRTAARRPVLHFSENPLNEAILTLCPSLAKRYLPSIWCFNRHLMLLVYLIREFKSKPHAYEQIEHLRMKDGGTTGLAWSGIDAAREKRPVVVVFHTISGDEQDMKDTVRFVTEQLGWAAVVCIRRGHGSLPLTTPVINTMGSTADLTAQLRHIRRRFPGSALFGIGISAGSGLLARYLGESGSKSLFQGAACISPAYDIEKAFHRVHPVYSRLMGQRLIAYFLKKHYDALSTVSGFSRAMESRNLAEFQDRLHTLAGFKSRDDYYKHSNPIKTAAGIKTPLLILNSEDDPICVNENVRENLHWLERLENTILVQTRRGSHVAYLEGVRGRSWADRVTGEYFNALHAVLSNSSARVTKKRAQRPTRRSGNPRRVKAPGKVKRTNRRTPGR